MQYSYPSPLDGVDLQTKPERYSSPAYQKFPYPIAAKGSNGFDVHVYFDENKSDQVQFASALNRRIQHEFPELRVFPLVKYPVGPHPIGMFEFHVRTPREFGAVVSWLVVNRGPLSALVHPNTTDDEMERDHFQRATWLGTPMELDPSIFERIRSKSG